MKKPNRKARRTAKRAERERAARLEEIRKQRAQAYKALEIGTELQCSELVEKCAAFLVYVDANIKALEDATYSEWMHEHLNV